APALDVARVGEERLRHAGSAELVVRERGDALHAGAQVAPERVHVARAGEAPRHADDRDAVEGAFRFHAVAHRLNALPTCPLACFCVAAARRAPPASRAAPSPPRCAASSRSTGFWKSATGVTSRPRRAPRRLAARAARSECPPSSKK